MVMVMGELTILTVCLVGELLEWLFVVVDYDDLLGV